MKITKRQFLIGALSCFTVAVIIAGYKNRHDTINRMTGADEPGLGADEVKDIVEEAVIYGFPIVMNYGVLYEHSIDRKSSDFKAPLNTLHNEARVYTAKDRSIVTPNSDTPYSTVEMDLRAEPVVLSVPAVETSRYYSVMLCDGNAFNFGYIGSRATGNEAGDYLVAGPDWKGTMPAGIKKVFRSSTQFSMALFRTQLHGPDDMENVKKVQAGYTVRMLSAFLHKPAPPPAPAPEFPKFSKLLMMQNFFNYLDFALQFAPPGPEEKAVREKLARIGIGPGKRFDFRTLSLKHEVEVAAGMKNAALKISGYALGGAKQVNGWTDCALFGGRAFYNGDWLKRAAAVGGGIFGNDAEEAVYFRATALENGDKLDGSKAAYTLTFAAGNLPPVHAFWSVTMYDGRTFLLVDNPINRYLINSAMLPGMKKNADGSLTLYIQKDSPGADREDRWLPAHNGPMILVLRLYWPKTEVLDGTWKPPVIETMK